ncbi:MAG: PhoH family protein [Eubacteriaceae bacterium]|jgi:phosphate starvation-inducible PhoH-like protein|nr:PhoH family protein [Eubacteriaceae bacterium]
MEKTNLAIPWNNAQSHAELFGAYDEYARIVEEAFQVAISIKGDSIHVSGAQANAESAKQVLLSLMSRMQSGQALSKQSVEYIVSIYQAGEDVFGVFNDIVAYTARGKQIRSKTIGQRKYIDSIKRNEITFAIGPAGTGKTYLAIAMAVEQYKSNNISRIILVRPAVEAGERLGFLPGDLKEKVDPYLRPIYDALYDIMGIDAYERNVARGAIEIAPLAYMRGRTLDDAFILLDEAQNTTPEQMKMFLTRLGYNSKAVITGDVTQVDLPAGRESGLVNVQRILKGIKGIEFVYLSKNDVVRNAVVQKIINAYEGYEAQEEK